MEIQNVKIKYPAMHINTNRTAIYWSLFFSLTRSSSISQTLVDGVAIIFRFFYDGIVLRVYDNNFGRIVLPSFLMQVLLYL